MPRFIADTHVVVHWLSSPKKLAREQIRVLHNVVHHGDTVAISAMTLLEIANLFGHGSTRLNASAADLLNDIASSPNIEILPLTIDIAAEVAALGPTLRDPADRTIVATARVHRLRLITSDQRIIDSNLVLVVA